MVDEKEKKGDMVVLISIHFSKMALGVQHMSQAHGRWLHCTFHMWKAAVYAHATAPRSRAAYLPGWIVK